MAKPVTGIKTSFAGGEFSPRLYSRVDLQKYAIGARTLKNVIVHPHGGASNRPGLEYIATEKTANKKIRLIPFEFSTTQTYIIEAGNYYFRFYTDGAQIEDADSYDNYTKLMMHCNADPFTDEAGNTIYDEDTNVKLLLNLNGPDGAMKFRDDGNTNHSANITAAGTATKSTTAQLGSGSLSLDGDSDWLKISDHANWNLYNNFTVEFFVRFNSLPTDGNQMNIFSQDNSVTADVWQISLYNDGGTYKWRVNVQATDDADEVNKLEAATVSVDTWYHIMVICDSNDWDIYQDAVQLGSSTTQAIGAADCDSGLYIGVYSDEANYHLDGYLDEIRISNTVRSVAVPTAEYSSDANTLLLLHCNLYDISSSNHISTWAGTAQIDTTAKKYGTASLQLDGDSDYISFANSTDWNILSQTNFTIDFWVKHDDHAGTEYYLQQREDASNLMSIWHEHGSGMKFYASGSPGAGFIDTGYGGEITDTDWHHVALIKVGNEYGMYLDGSQINYDTTSDTDTFTGSLYIGASGVPGSYFDGHIDDIRISHSNIFNAAPVAGLTDTFTTPASEITISDVTLDETDKKFGAGSAYFTGDDRLYLSDSDDWYFGTDNFSIDFQVYFESTTGQQGIIGQYEDGDNYWIIRKEADGKLAVLFQYDGSTVGYYYTTSAPTINATTWYHIEVTRNGSNCLIFLDGTSLPLTASTSFGSNNVGNISGYLYIGYDASSSAYLNGNLDEIRISKGVARHTANFTAPTGAYEAGAVLEVATPYSEDDLANLYFTQSADVLYLAHPDYAPRQLERLANDDWELNTFDYENGPFQIMNTDTTDTIAASAVTGDGITLTASGFTFNALHDGALFKLRHYVEAQTLTEAITGTGATSSISCGGTWRLITHGTWTMTIQIEKSTDGGSTWTTLREFSSADDFNANTYGTEDLIDDEPFLIRLNCTSDTSGTCNANLSSDAWYQEGIALITAVAAGGATATANVVKDMASTDATSDWYEGSWSDYRGWPATVEFHPEDRLVWANTYNEPQTYWMSKTGNYTDFGTSSPIVDSDAISSPLPSRKVNGINGLVALSEMLAMTLSSEASIRSSSGPITPSTAYNKIHGWEGSYGIKPVVIGNRALYVQSTGSVVRDIGFNSIFESFEGQDTTIFSSHLFEGYTITEMDYQQNPDRIAWLVRSDGALLSLTYMKEQEVLAWTHHDTNSGTDTFESVAVIRGDGYDEVWVSVNRGGTRYIERMVQRMASTDLEDQFFVDCGYTYDSTSTTTITGLDHLEGKTVVALADGIVRTGLTVASGQITLPVAASKVHVGLSYTSDIETLNVDYSAEDGTIQGKKVKISQVVLQLINSKGGKIGPDSSTLYDIGYSRRASYDSTSLFTGDVPETLSPKYADGGRVFIRQTDPLPITVSAIIPQVTIGGMTQIR